MTRFDSGLSPLFWNTLFECIRRERELPPEEKVVLVASPWLSDVELYGCRWHQSMLSTLNKSQAFSSLIDVLGVLCNLGYQVELVLAARRGKFLPAKTNEMVKREKILIDKATQKGVRCSFRSDFHSKELVTPFAILSGSSNWTKNGLWNLIEHLEYKHRERDADAATFDQERQNILEIYIAADRVVIDRNHVNAVAAGDLHPIHQAGVIEPTPSGGEAFVAFVEEDSVLDSDALEAEPDENHAAIAFLQLLEGMKRGEASEELVKQAAALLNVLT